MSETLKQWDRVNRALAKIEDNRNRNIEEYEDDVWSFFQNCWHLKDWIKNDNTIDNNYRSRVEKDVKEIESIIMCADLANRSKHLKLTSSRVDANVSSRDLHIHAAPPGQGGYGEYNFKITNAEGAAFNAIEIAKDSVQNWSKLLTAYEVI